MSPRNGRRAGILIATGAAVLTFGAVALGQSASGYDLSFHALLGGGSSTNQSSTDNFAIQGVIGQTVSGTSSVSGEGGAYRLESGMIEAMAAHFHRVIPALATDGLY